MKRVKDKRWPTILFFVIIAVFLSASAYYIFGFEHDKKFERYYQKAADQKPIESASFEKDGVLYLLAGKPLDYHELRILYRGEKGGKIIFDLFLMELDREYAYHRAFPVQEAAERMQLGDHPFKLLRASETDVRLKAIPR